MEKTCSKILEQAIPKVNRALRADARRKPVDLNVAKDAASDFFESMKRVWNDLRITYTSSAGGMRYSKEDGFIAIEVSGRRPIDSLELVYSQPPTSTPDVEIRYYRDGRIVRRNLSGASRLTGNVLTIDAGLLSTAYPHLKSRQNGMRNHRRRLRPAYYELFLKSGAAPANPLSEIRFIRGNDVSAPATPVDHLPRKDLRGLFLAVPELPHRSAVNWNGELSFRGNHEIYEDVLIAAGTRLQMAPGANLRFWGRVIAEGTAENPIEIGPMDPDQSPWGVVALQGHGTDGSRFQHCNFKLGSGWKQPMWEYSAMFSVHNSDDVIIRNSKFEDSRVVDDMVHTVYSHVEFHDSIFDRSLMDALDMDISTGRVVGCLFRGSGNDSLDLMTSNIVVDRTRIIDSGDKGISVGENTVVFCRDVAFIRCLRGIEGKDSSQAYVYNSLFDSNKLAINAYKKNWRYGDGGHVILSKCRMVNTRESLKADRYSSISVHDSYTDTPLKASKRITVDSLTDSKDPKHASQRRPQIIPRQLKPIYHLVHPHFEKINFNIRGPSAGKR